MAKPKNKATRTYVCQGLLNRGTKVHEILEDRRIAPGVLFDATLNELQANHQGETLDTNQSQLLTTIVSKKLGIQKGPLNRRCRIAIAQKAVNAWNNHVKHDYGLPKQYDGKPVSTIDTIDNNGKFPNPLVTFNNGGNPKLHFPGLPRIRLYSCRPLPQDQPTYASVSVKGRQVTVNLTYHLDQEPLSPHGHWNLYKVLGLDRGLTELIASAGLSFQGIAQQKLQDKIRKAAQLKQAIVRKAVKAGLAGFNVLLDKENRQILKVSRGHRQTDNFNVFDDPEAEEDGTITARFFLHHSHSSPATMGAASLLRMSDVVETDVSPHHTPGQPPPWHSETTARRSSASCRHTSPACSTITTSAP